MTQHERRTAIVADIVERTGIDGALIERLVRAFYGRIRNDPLLGPIFDERIADWEPHLRRMCAFWSSVVLLTGEYHGRPMEKHAHLPVDARHFDRWLALFNETAHQVCQPAAAALIVERAKRIADSLELGIAGQQGIFLARDQRLRRPDIEVFLPADARTDWKGVAAKTTDS